MKKANLIADLETKGYWIEENRRANSSKFIC